jgi:peroxiredoxin
MNYHIISLIWYIVGEEQPIMDESAPEKREDKSYRGLEGSHINRNGLPHGTLAPAFRLARVDGGELALDEYRGQQVLLVFSDPNCEPCNQLAPKLERLHRSSFDLQVLMVSRGDLETNRRKVSEHRLTFPVILQHRWEISREYGIFATPIAYLIDEQGITMTDVAVGADAILALTKERGQAMQEHMRARLEMLRKELEKGQLELQKVESQRTYLHETVLRISGAIQVLEELLTEGHPAEQNGIASSDKAQLATTHSSGIDNRQM